MRSYVLSILEPDKVNLSAWIAPVFPDPEQVEAELRRVVLPYVRWEPAEEAQAGDLAVCRTESELPRFQKNRLKLLIGSGMFHSELEQAVIGMTPGSCRAVALPEGEARRHRYGGGLSRLSVRKAAAGYGGRAAAGAVEQDDPGSDRRL